MLRNFLFVLYSIFLFVSTSASIENHSNASESIERIQKAICETDRFWFGDQWRFNCAQSSDSRNRMNSVQCINPRELISFHSLGSRLFRVNTFTPAYLQNLRIYPRVRYTPQAGSYRACDHDFVVKSGDDSILETEVDMDSPPISTYQIKNRPTLDWLNLRHNDSYVVLMLDAGFGTLKYLAVDFPRSTHVVREYEPLDNFRLSQPTPFVVLIFEAPQDSKIITEKLKNYEDNEKSFDLTQFMIDFELDDGLIGLNWFLVKADGFAIERQRLKGVVDNCHALVQQKLIQNRRWNFVEMFPLYEMDSSLTISVNQPQLSFQACCKIVTTREDIIFADPLSDRQIPSIALRSQPLVTSFRSLEFADNYQRSQRHYIVLKEERYTLIMFDPAQRYLYWMIVDIPAEALTVGDYNEAVLIAPYVAPIPKGPGKCALPVFILFKQPASVEMTEFYNNDHVFRSRFCVGHCIYRNSFDIEQFKSFHRLQFSAISWIKVCYDIFEANYEIQNFLKASVTNFTGIIKPRNHRKPSLDGMSNTFSQYGIDKGEAIKKAKIQMICSKLLEAEYKEQCSINTATKWFGNYPLLILSFCFAFAQLRIIFTS